MSSTEQSTILSCCLVMLADSQGYSMALEPLSRASSPTINRKTNLWRSSLSSMLSPVKRGMNSIQDSSLHSKSTYKTYCPRVASALAFVADVVHMSNSNGQESTFRKKWTWSSSCKKCVSSMQPSYFSCRQSNTNS